MGPAPLPTGRPFAPMPLRLRGAGAAAAVAYLLVVLGLPMLSLLLAALVPAIGVRLSAATFTLANFAAALAPGAQTGAAFGRSLVLAGVAALVLAAAAGAIALAQSHRSVRLAGAAADLPYALPGACIGVAAILIVLRAYAEVMATLGVGGYRDEALGLGGEIDHGPDHCTCFQFDYDWRQDNVTNAHRYGVRDADVKLDIVAHSMGGIVARYAMLYGGADLPADGSLPPLTFEGARFMARLIQIGTPNGDSPDAFRVLVDGRDFGTPIVPSYSPAILGTFPSLYQLLPRARSRPVVLTGSNEVALDLHDPEVWQRMGWGIAKPGIDAGLATLMPDVAAAEERRRLAADLQARLLRRARAFAAAMERGVTQPAGTEPMAVARDALPMTMRMAADPETGRIEPLQRAAGDGLVLRDSALLDFRQGQEPRGLGVITPMDVQRVLFLPREHLEITRDPTFRNNILFCLLDEPRRR
ncbi:lipase/acyltransferase domain-containing protein [Roseomonas sp. HF4]|uniref:lipase/acyltransferase domain-containing protein n=1 Tax=Roseomonas sp. HF4 TaxID=2562313 RepID=UPI0010BFAF39|nr:hypothetical protein [Roseomonas sp. HF4]